MTSFTNQDSIEAVMADNRQIVESLAEKINRTFDDLYHAYPKISTVKIMIKASGELMRATERILNDAMETANKEIKDEEMFLITRNIDRLIQDVDNNHEQMINDLASLSKKL